MASERAKLDMAVTGSSVADHFRSFAAEYDNSTEWCSDPALLEPLVAGIGSRRVLDLGSGTGLVAEAVQSCGGGGKVWGLDLSYPMLRKAQERLGPCVFQAEAEVMPLRAASIDVVVCRQLLHYTREAEVLCETARVLRLGGELRLAQITSRDERDFAFWSTFKAVVQPLRRRYYSPQLLRSVVERCCFQVFEMHPYCMRRRYSREDLFRRSPLPERERKSFLSWLKDQTEELRGVLAVDWNEDGGVTVDQFWTVLLCIRRS